MEFAPKFIALAKIRCLGLLATSKPCIPFHFAFAKFHSNGFSEQTGSQRAKALPLVKSAIQCRFYSAECPSQNPWYGYVFCACSSQPHAHFTHLCPCLHSLSKALLNSFGMGKEKPFHF